MRSNTLLSVFVVLVIIFGTMTLYKLDSYPEDDCCKDISNSDSKVCQDCDKYNIVEKIIYVWKFS